MVRVDVSKVIARPVQEVWDFFVDLPNSPRWTRSGSELRQTSDGPLGVGSTVESVRPLFGREIKSQRMVATAFEPPQLISFTADVKLLGRIVGGFTFESVDKGTRLSRWTEADLGRGERLLAPLLVRVVGRFQRTELANLKRLIEAQPSAVASG